MLWPAGGDVEINTVTTFFKFGIECKKLSVGAIRELPLQERIARTGVKIMTFWTLLRPRVELTLFPIFPIFTPRQQSQIFINNSRQKLFGNYTIFPHFLHFPYSPTPYQSSVANINLFHIIICSGRA